MTVRLSLHQMLEHSARGETFTLQEIGNALGISRERVRQIESIALQKIRRAL
jgi:DNA-directed RNA polymerase sigma subunit (sigma70/sigma32)